MRRLLQLPVLALAVWAAFAGLLALLAAMVAARAWHPHFLPVTAVLAVMLASGLALVVGGAWRLIRGPGRLRAAAYLLLGAAPLLLFTGHFLYGMKAGRGRQFETDWALKMLMPLGESFFDLLTRFQYPVRTEGETVVMISIPVANAREQVAAMDRHVRTLRRRLGGGEGTDRVHWVRGPVLGIGGRAIYGMCLGSRPGEMPVDDEGLASFDRHEVAHCVLNAFMPAGVNPPAVLTEGWAQANMGHGAKTAAIQAWEFREQGSSLSLRTLIAPGWYARHHSPACLEGAALVNHLFRAFGPAKFLELYATCRPGTFPQDCQRVLGIDLDQLDADYWSNVERLVGSGGPAMARLRAMKVQKPVTRAAWNAFLDEYQEKSRALMKPYDNVRMTFERRTEYSDAQGKPAVETQRASVLRAGERAAIRVAYPELEVAHLATPDLSFKATRHSGQRTWEILDPPPDDRDAAYRRALQRINPIDQVRNEAAVLLAFIADLAGLADPPRIVVTRLDRFEDQDRPLVRVRLDDPAPAPIQWRSVTIVMAADESLAARSADVELADGSRMRAQVEYDHREDVAQPVVGGIRLNIEDRDGKPHTGKTTILERTFGPIPTSEFTESKLLDGPVVHKPAPAVEEAYNDPATFADWYRAPLIAGVAAVACGLAVGLLGGFRSPQAPAPVSDHGLT